MISSLTREQKEAVGLLQVGTFLEYFDLMLYVHMAVLLNELFFPKTDPHTASLITALSFCSTFVLRPFGALLFGYIGDHIGRKTTVIITTIMMAISCMTMASVPTYAQIGIAASWIVTICRALQGLSSMGEIIGAEIYLTELTRPPVQYFAVALLGVFATFGMTFALGIASLVTSYNFNWRLAFLMGAGIALVGVTARTRLRETPDFVDMKKRMKRAVEDARENDLGVLTNILKKTNTAWQEKTTKATPIAYFFIQCVWPIWFYFAYVHCGNILKNSFGWTAEQIVHRNFGVAMVEFLASIVVAYLSYRIHPLKILKVLLSIFFVFVLMCPYLLHKVTTPSHVLFLQLFIVVFAPSDFPAVSVFFKHFPVFRRFTYASLVYALSRASMYIITSFGLVYLIEYLGHWGLWVIILPAIIGYAYGIYYFDRLENPDKALCTFWKRPSFLCKNHKKMT